MICINGIHFTKMFTKIARVKNKKVRKKERRKEDRCNYNLVFVCRGETRSLKKHC